MLDAYDRRMHLVRHNQGLRSYWYLRHYNETMRMRNIQWSKFQLRASQKKIPGFLKPRNFGLDEETSDKKKQNKINPDQNLELTNS